MAGIKEAAVPREVGVIECFGSSLIRPVYNNVGLLCISCRWVFLYNFCCATTSFYSINKLKKTSQDPSAHITFQKTRFIIMGITLYQHFMKDNVLA